MENFDIMVAMSHLWAFGWLLIRMGFAYGAGIAFDKYVGRLDWDDDVIPELKAGNNAMAIYQAGKLFALAWLVASAA